MGWIAEMEVQAAMNYGISVEAEGYETGHGEVSLRWIARRRSN